MGSVKAKILLGIADPDIVDPTIVLALSGRSVAKGKHEVGRAKSNYKVGQAKAEKQ